MFDLVGRKQNSIDVFFRPLSLMFDDEFFGNLKERSLGNFKANIWDKEKEYILEAELPGMKKENIKITYDKEMLTIRAKRKESTEEKDEKKNYIRKEMFSGEFVRSFIVKDIEKEGIKASYVDGILKVSIPKKKIKNDSCTIDID